MEIIDNFLQDKYKVKRAKIIAVFSVIFLLFIFLMYLWLKPIESCTDGIKNQNETEVDCGGMCPNKCEKIVAQPLTVQEQGFVTNGAVDKIDLYGRITNPNNVFGSNKFQYEFIIKDATGNIVASKIGSNYALPAESKYIIENNIEVSGAPSTVELNIINESWVEFTDYFERPQIKVVNKEYNQISSGVGFSEAKGLLKNESDFNFNSISLNIILKDSNGTIIAVNSTAMNTVKSRENRDFKAIWLNRFSGEVMNVEVQSEVNVFEVDAFIKQYFPAASL
jgi:hypothetical protein